MFVRSAVSCSVTVIAAALVSVIAGAAEYNAFEDLNNPIVVGRALWCADAVAHGGRYSVPAEWPHPPQVGQLTHEEREACDPLIRKLRASAEESDRRKAAEKATRDVEEAERQRRAAMPHR